MGIFSKVEEAYCILWLAYGLDEIGSVPIIFPREISLLQFVLCGFQAMPPIQCLPVVLSEVEVNGKSSNSAVADNVWKYNSIAPYSNTVFTIS